MKTIDCFLVPILLFLLFVAGWWEGSHHQMSVIVRSIQNGMNPGLKDRYTCLFDFDGHRACFSNATIRGDYD